MGVKRGQLSKGPKMQKHLQKFGSDTVVDSSRFSVRCGQHTIVEELSARRTSWPCSLRSFNTIAPGRYAHSDGMNAGALAFRAM